MCQASSMPVRLCNPGIKPDKIKINKNPQRQESQSIGIHNIVNAQGLVMHYRAISNRLAILKFSDVRENH